MKKDNITLARKYEYKCLSGHTDLDNVAAQKDQNYETETTWWIFKDGSAIGLDSSNAVYINDSYGLSPDNEILNNY